MFDTQEGFRNSSTFVQIPSPAPINRVPFCGVVGLGVSSTSKQQRQERAAELWRRARWINWQSKSEEAVAVG